MKEPRAAVSRLSAALLLIAAGGGLATCGGGQSSSGGAAPTSPGQTAPQGSSGTQPTTRTDVVTYKDDVLRTGQNLTESVLTPSNVTSATFGLLLNLMVDAKVDAEPLYLSQLSIAGTAHDTVFVATENDSVYAFDADTGATLWHVSLTITSGCTRST
jgi:PQQ enzyme repeat